MTINLFIRPPMLWVIDAGTCQRTRHFNINTLTRFVNPKPFHFILKDIRDKEFVHTDIAAHRG